MLLWLLLYSCTVVNKQSYRKLLKCKVSSVSFYYIDGCTEREGYLIYVYVVPSHIKEKIRQFSDDFLSCYTTDHPISTLWNHFKSLCNVCTSLIPSKSISTNNNHPWLSTFIKRLSRRKKRCYNRARLSHHPEDCRD